MNEKIDYHKNAIKMRECLMQLAGVDTDEKLFEHITGINPSRCVNEYMAGGIARWFLYGIKGGSFLTAALNRDWERAALASDSHNKKHLYEWIILVTQILPRACTGPHMERWAAHSGYLGIAGHVESLNEEYKHLYANFNHP